MARNKDSVLDLLTHHNYCVYWLKKSSMTDILSHGYCGITSSPITRLAAHKRERSTNEDMVILASNLTKGEALTLEHMLRPLRNIGENKKAGGDYINIVRSEKILKVYKSITKEDFYCAYSTALALCQWENNLLTSDLYCKKALQFISQSTGFLFRLTSGIKRYFKMELLHIKTIDDVYLHDCFIFFCESSTNSGKKIKFNRGNAIELDSMLKSFVADYGWEHAIRIMGVALATACCAEYHNRRLCGVSGEFPLVLPEATRLTWTSL